MYSKKGLTIEYVMLMMVVVALFVVVILFAVGRGTTIANGYRTYVERKAFLDDVGQTYIDNFNGSDIDSVDSLLTEKLDGNSYGLQFSTTFDNSTNIDTLQVTSQSGSVLLWVEILSDGTDGTVVRYSYGSVGVA